MSAAWHFLVIGIGTGDPDQVTLQAMKALNRADLILLPRKGAAKEDLADLRRDICRTHLTNPNTRVVEFDMPVRDVGNPSYRGGVDGWHDQIAAIHRGLIEEHLRQGGSVGLLVWGDPSLYDSTLRILDRLRGAFAFSVEVIPGITSLQALTAAHAIPLNRIGEAVEITTGRKLRMQGFPSGVDTVAVMLDGDMAFRALPAHEFEIFWGGNLGFPDAVSIGGKLENVADAIVAAREALREKQGWVMDIYVLRRLSGR